MNLLILTGPTGVGKTELSLKIAKKYNGEIISADSMQIYKEFNIGTAKIDVSKTDIVHHMIDVVDADEEFSVYNFQEKTKELIKKLNEKGKLPIIVGGTGLYINSIVYNLNFQSVGKDLEYRKNLESLASKNGVEYLYSMLKERDPESASVIDSNNIHRIIRALEISQNTFKENSNLKSENKDYNLLFLALNMDRQKLYENINRRVDYMINQGLIEEVKYLIDKYNTSSQAFKAIGYKEVISYLKNEIDKEEMIELIKKNSRHYAKRQLTWFRRDNRIIWLDKENENLLTTTYNLIGDRFGK